MKLPPPNSNTGLQDQGRMAMEFNNLPENIQQYFDDDFSIKIPGRKQNSPFGKINKNFKAKKIKLKNGNITYTFALLSNNNYEISKLQEEYYFDNLVIKENNKFKDDLYVIRYEPTQEWLTTGHDLDDFMGIITFYSIEGEKLNSIDTRNVESSNQSNKEVCPAYLVSTTYSCTGMESSSTQSCYWIYTYEIRCTSGTPTVGGAPGDGPTDPESIPTEPTEDWDTGSGDPSPTPTDPEPDDCNTFDNKVSDVINTEGAYTNDPNDPGGPTNKGISWATWVANAQNVLNVSPTLENLQNLTSSQAKLIYKEKYWDKIKADDINDGDLRYLLFDFTVNAGNNTVKEIQKVLNNFDANLTVDGSMGPNTLSSINNYSNQIQLYNSLKTSRMNYYERITNRSMEGYLDLHPNATDAEITQNTLKKYINGWKNRVEAFIDKTLQNHINVNC